MEQPARLLTIAGSDSGGAAGLQADLKTWTLLGVYGMSVITAVTAQNSVEVAAVHFLPPSFVVAQLDAVLSDYGATAVKTGFLGQVALIEAVAATLPGYELEHILIDPVLVNHRGEAMFPPAVTEAYRRHLLPLASLITPNWREAAMLAGMSPEQLREAAGIRTAVSRLQEYGARGVLITGLREGEQIVDWLSDGWEIRPLSMPWLDTGNRHGSGDTLSAAICAYLAEGQPLATAVQKAQRLTAVALQKAAGWRLGRGHGPLAHIMPG